MAESGFRFSMINRPGLIAHECDWLWNQSRELGFSSPVLREVSHFVLHNWRQERCNHQSFQADFYLSEEIGWKPLLLELHSQHKLLWIAITISHALCFRHKNGAVLMLIATHDINKLTASPEIPVMRQRPLTMRRDLIQTRKRRCAKKHLSSSNHLQQQQQQQWHEPRLESIDGQAHSSIIKRQYLAASNPYAYFPSRTVKTEPYVMPGKLL
ncbi:hypothetical protein EGR_02185 [Echinococcus granulosus]|uniref:Uncharacterized protein n=1 Tax=Echinococcus granulosus TaxID=6210 RepID=W6UQX5_ECHGR|nr:hypothetical protein EGR_02185 [Echinococcus granulosus]EUB63091.1 hypothetical protein EGR_02185 [Echinococcus granulosus]